MKIKYDVYTSLPGPVIRYQPKCPNGLDVHVGSPECVHCEYFKRAGRLFVWCNYDKDTEDE